MLIAWTLSSIHINSVPTSIKSVQKLHPQCHHRLNNILKTCEWIEEHLEKTSLDIIRMHEGAYHSRAKHECLGVLFDLVELYPLLSKDARVFDLIYEFLSHWDIVVRRHFICLIETLFHYSWFYFQDLFFQQTSRLAMGHAHNAPLANL